MSNIAAYIANDANYTSVLAAVGFAGLKLDLEGDNLMLFAPSNSVFEGTPEQYRWNKALTKGLLLNHVATKQDLDTTAKTFATLAGDNIIATTTKISKGTGAFADVDSTVKTVTSTYAIYDINNFLIPKSQSDAPITKTLFDGTDERLGALEMSDTLKGVLGKLANDEGDSFDEQLGYTVFLPTTEAFSNLLANVGTLTGVAEFLEDDGLDETLLAHTVVGGAPVQATEYVSANSYAVSKIDVDTTNMKVTIGSDTTDLNTNAVNFKNGQVHNIDEVLYFPRNSTVEIASTATKELYKLIASVDGLAGTLQSLTRSTVFAPTDAALEPLLCLNNWIPVSDTDISNVLKHHVVKDSRLYSNKLKPTGEVAESVLGEMINRTDISVATADVIATNGNIHVVDKLIVPPSLRNVLPKGTIVDIALTSAKELAKYVGLADLGGALSTCPTSGKAYTVFAPTDAAFSVLTPEDIDYLNKGDNLKKVLLHHVVAAPAFAKDLQEDNSFDTLNGDKVGVRKISGDVSVGGSAKVIQADVQAFNGVIHIIDEVLIPAGMELPSKKGSTASKTMVSAISTALLGAASYFLASF